ncbi:ROK family transcriptional regulator [Williamsia sp. MIQD14]|uniref:ROK family transcriptional regulator n=1 Tax=Williamsia sp. MIQD14 TaxID=3425703 RepID=UPI003DA09F98
MHIATPRLQLSTRPSAVVLRTARLQGPIFRDDAAAGSGLSISTVNRQVSALLKAGLVRERADLAPAGAIGRPRLPFEVNVADFLTVGIHIGLKVTSITTHDLLHRVVGAIQIPTPAGDNPEQTLTAIGLSARRFASRWPSQRLLWTGVAIGGRVAEGGFVDHPRLGWTAAPVGPVLSQTIGLPVSVASHVEAMAAAELLVNPQQSVGTDEPGSFLYFYAREMVGIAFTVGGTVYTPTAGPPVIGHFPSGPTTLLDPRRTGTLEASASDTGVVEAARAAGLTVESIDDVHAAAAAGDETASAILLERAEVLGRAVSLIADIFNPDHVILGGQAFTDAPSTLPAVARAVRATPAASNRDVRVTRAGAGVQQQAAGAVALDAIYSDPLGALALTA